MASGSEYVWALDVGSRALRALHLRLDGETVEVLESELIEHRHLLSAPEVGEEQKEQYAAETIKKFASKHDLRGEEVAISVPGQTSFARFVKLPPVDKKQLTKLVRHEAAQQIPFDIHEVEWDYELMSEEDSPDTSIGIFAIKNELVESILSHYTEAGIRVNYVQMAPMAIYNYAAYEFPDVLKNPGKAIVLLDIGTDNTNLVVCSGNSVWQRCIPMGGNDFTEAVSDAFKIDFEKAEKLKRNSQSSKYAKQIFQAMRRTYTELSEEIQRSLGYYSDAHKVDFVRVIGLGGGFKLQGLAKYLQQSLGIKMFMPTEFKKVRLSSGVSAASFHQNILDNSVAYGIGLQALGKAPINANLLPTNVARTMAWKQKSVYMYAAAFIFLIACIAAFGKSMADKIAYSANQDTRREVRAVIDRAQDAISKLEQQKQKDEKLEEKISKYMDYFDNRDIIPSVVQGIGFCMPNAENNPEQSELYEAFQNGNIEKVKQTPRSERKQIFVSSLVIDYTDSIKTTAFSETRKQTDRGGTDRTASPFGGGGGFDPFGGGGGGFDPFGGGGGTMGGMQTGAEGEQRTDEEETEEDGPGFVVVVEGYSPYSEIGKIMDPAGVGDNKDKWGFVTRLENFKEVFERYDIELYQKESSNHFEYETGPVSPESSEMPVGIGIEKTVERLDPEESKAKAGQEILEEETVLIDPVTGEEMSKVVKTDQSGVIQFDDYGEKEYVIRDHWFKLKFKFLWKDAPEADSETEVSE
ncbi:type IV pilus assembly protein PilM [Sedimentisphaera salicampi]|uniref:type IV pilus assembly protein PilM n=1 Tax=Sedimentisphaera salicampi TaxID=1941349 RepID=UPI000B9B0D79|nr:type IV pilus assembly protein PilM [Sedimentisphaera salicampi]OXU14353.1 ethanolamine utilization protein EutJ [Sedimentisphaera salicampi]